MRRRVRDERSHFRDEGHDVEHVTGMRQCDTRSAMVKLAREIDETTSVTVKLARGIDESTSDVINTVELLKI